ncbi:DUF4231 domain-containing protein [Streptomyces seoulensis]|uniref:DUF4231 domain-containing protein n=1 Tax=Streptomyces seoulensis TaxID=73044 RepID=UPI0036CE918C
MAVPTDPAANSSDYAMSLADGSYAWYRRAAIKARRFHRAAETMLLLVSAAIPVSAVVSPQDATTPAVLGSVVVVLTGLRALFHWHDDYVRFSQAREAVEAERRLYRTSAKPYGDPGTRDRLLATAVTRIEQQEMGTWVQLVGTTNESTGETAAQRTVPPA